MGLVRVTKPSLMLLNHQELQKQCELLDGDHDSYLTRLLENATAAAERYTGRAFATQTWRLTLDRFPCRTIKLPRPPLQSVTSITYIDEDGAEQTLDSSLYVVATDSHPGRVAPAYDEVWPATRTTLEAVKITYVAGHTSVDDVPEEAKQAVGVMVADWFVNRETTTEKEMRRVPLSAQWLLNGLKIGQVPGWYELV